MFIVPFDAAPFDFAQGRQGRHSSLFIDKMGNLFDPFDFAQDRIGFVSHLFDLLVNFFLTAENAKLAEKFY